jgi:hypothetical protein
MPEVTVSIGPLDVDTDDGKVEICERRGDRTRILDESDIRRVERRSVGV